MTNEELKEAMTSGEAVEHRGITYSCITAIIYRQSEAGLIIQAELMDKNKNCVVIAHPIEVKRSEDKEAK
ncbi:hypothetical protein [Paenibacillus thiaminolyticus]|uniref:hypothetical protein n=1 Tax=Paenibacillus thiaminolyticus TaxID=49283 RepID=UPI0025438ED7|nr:hypothetical protein [Paenibacillus thiaminolyticus]WII39165.1 hypothetical protein O0V01_08790 [Paenibacillus thiaminolyticus]